MKPSLAFVCVFMVACGSGLPSGNSLGDGSQTLEVSGSVSAENRIANASDPNDFSTQFRVRVRRDGAVVQDAVVVVESDAGQVELTLRDGEYVGSQSGYFEIYRLDVDAADDFVHGVRVDGPDIHTIETPDVGGTVDATADLVVEWSRHETAEEAWLDLRGMDELTIEDSGSYTVPVSALEWSLQETNQERVRLERANRISPVGTAGSSSFTVSVRNELEFLAVP